MDENLENDEVQSEEEKLYELHERLIDEYLQLLRGGKPLKASMLNTIRQFLRDQGVTLSQIKLNKQQERYRVSLDDLELPFTGGDD